MSRSDEPVVQPFARDSFERPTLSSIDRLAARVAAKGLTKLTVVVLGRAGVGKSSLVNSILGESVAPVATWKPPHGRQKFDPALTMVTRRLKQNVLLEIVDTPGIPDDGGTGDLGRILDTLHKKCGVVHLFLYVTRLDDSRRDRGDFVAATHITRAFGRDCWERCCLVFTHGCALPPHTLSYTQLVRGRRDLVWEAVRQTMPYRKVRRLETEESADAVDESISGSAELIPEQPDYIFEDPDDGADEALDSEQFVGDRPTQPSSRWLAWTRILQIPVATSELSPRLDAADSEEPPGVEFNYHYLKAPEVVVAENSHFCPANGEGQKVLPDGVPWKQEFFDTLGVIVSEIGEKPRDAYSVEVLEESVLDRSDFVTEEPRLDERRRELPIPSRRKKSYGFWFVALQFMVTTAIILATHYMQKKEEDEAERQRASRTADENGDWTITKEDVKNDGTTGAEWGYEEDEGEIVGESSDTEGDEDEEQSGEVEGAYEAD